MTEQTYSLIPFPAPGAPAIQITSRVRWENRLLNVQFMLSGDTAKVRLPDRSSSAARKDDLWSTTCFELFLAIPDQPRYWEINLSPSGDWNIYRMDAYRRVGFREEMSIQRLQLAVENEAQSISLQANIDLSPLVAKEQRLQAGISSIIHSVDRHESYWALAHPYPVPDFHIRDSFVVQL